MDTGHQHHACTGGPVPGHPGLTYGENPHGLKVWDDQGNMTGYYSGADDALDAYYGGDLDYHAGDSAYYGLEDFGAAGSSHYSYSPGMDASEVDQFLIQPHQSWRGVRGARINFAGDEEEDDYGRLYVGNPDHRLIEPALGDTGALLGRSGSSGYRGGRPSFGADLPGPTRVETPHGRYEGSELGGIAFAMASLLLVFKSLES